MNKYTVVGMYEDGETWVEWVEAIDDREAITKACHYSDDNYARYNGDIIAVFEGHHKDVYNREASWDWTQWECPSCHREYDWTDLPNECECGERPPTEEEI